ncbi:MAG: hypothetical protein R2724_23155 [Bryobacterales bacterium]
MLSSGSTTKAAEGGATRPDHPYAPPYQRDRDRIVIRAFRRLESNAGLHLALSDHFRDRLTHTIEVTQAARTTLWPWG